MSLAASVAYVNFRFRLKMGDRYVAGLTKVSGMSGTGQPPSAIVLSRGVTYDDEFLQWANKTWDYTNAHDADPAMPSKDVRRDLAIDGYDDAGARVFSYAVHDCWPSAFVANPELDGTGNAVVIESLTLQNSGWELADPSSGSVTSIPGS
jgi:phage tail-like protein